MTIAFLFDFISSYSLTVLGTVNQNNSPESALVGFIVTPGLKIFFDTVTTSRKYQNLIANPNISFVFGWVGEKTVQYEGIARIPGDKELELLLPEYFKVFSDGKDRNKNWIDVTYFVVEPKWIRFSDFSGPVKIEEMRFE